MDGQISEIKPIYSPTSPPDSESTSIYQTISLLSLQPHPEGGYFRRTDRSPLRVPNPFPDSSPPTVTQQTGRAPPAPVFSTF
jgi:hypothetical protein